MTKTRICALFIRMTYHPIPGARPGNPNPMRTSLLSYRRCQRFFSTLLARKSIARWSSKRRFTFPGVFPILPPCAGHRPQTRRTPGAAETDSVWVAKAEVGREG